MLEPTLFAGLDSQLHDRVQDLYAAADDARSRPLPRPAAPAGLVARTRGSLGRFLVSLGGQVAGQPQA